MTVLLIGTSFREAMGFAEYHPGLTDYLGAMLVAGVIMTGFISLAYLDL